MSKHYKISLKQDNKMVIIKEHIYYIKNVELSDRR